MAFLRFPTKIGTKKDAMSATQAPRTIPRAVPKPVAKPAPGPTTVIEGPKRRMIGVGTARVGRQYTILGVIFAVLFAAAAFIGVQEKRAGLRCQSYRPTSRTLR